MAPQADIHQRHRLPNCLTNISAKEDTATAIGTYTAFQSVGALLASTRRPAIEQMYILAMASLMTLLVGVSRVALGVHWATDVLAGWAFGAAWALVWLLLAQGFVRKPAEVHRQGTP